MATPTRRSPARLAASGVSLALTPSSVKIEGGLAEASSPALIVRAPIPGAGPIPAGFFTIVIGATQARAAASPGFDVSDVADLTSTPIGAVQGETFTSAGDSGGSSLPDLSASGGSTFSPTSPAATAPSPQSGLALNAAAVGQPTDYHFAGVSSRLVLVILLLGIVGVRLIRRYMRRLLSIGRQ